MCSVLCENIEGQRKIRLTSTKMNIMQCLHFTQSNVFFHISLNFVKIFTTFISTNNNNSIKWQKHMIFVKTAALLRKVLTLNTFVHLIMTGNSLTMINASQPLPLLTLGVQDKIVCIYLKRHDV